jgi:hypothetical protein
MHANHFDTLTKHLAAPATRRFTVRLLTGSLLGGVFAHRSVMTASAETHAECEAKGMALCGGTAEVSVVDGVVVFGEITGTCTDIQNDPRNCGACGNDCGELTCQNYACFHLVDEALGVQLACETQGLAECGGVCVDVASDPTNCGACGYACGGFACVLGSCVELASAPEIESPGIPSADLQLTCEAQGLADCLGVCVDLSADPANCGACGHACAGGHICDLGVCI